MPRITASYPSFDDPAEIVPLGRAQRGGETRSAATLIAGTIDLRGLWLVLRWRARLIASITTAIAVLAAGLLIVLPPKYLATAVILVDPRQPNVTNTQAVLSGIGADAAAVESQVELIESSALIGKVIAKLTLADDPEFASPSLLETVSQTVSVLLGGDIRALEKTKSARLIDKLERDLAVRRRGLTYVLEISYQAKDPARAAWIANAVADAYLEDQRAVKEGLTTEASGWLKDRIAEMRDRVRRSEEAVQAYRAAHSIVDVTQGNKLINRQIEDLTQQIALARSRAADARARLEQVQQALQRNGDPAALNQSLQSQVIANLRSQFTEAARLQAEYSALYGNRYPGLIAVRAQLADVRRQINDELARILTGVRNEYEATIGGQTTLEAELASLKDQSAALGEADVKLRELEREAQANRTLFEQFLGRAKETTEEQSLQIADARVVSPALPPLKPARPGALLLIAVAACGGMILSVGMVLVMEQLRQGFRSLREVMQFLSLPGLGVLPQQDKGGSRWRSLLRKLRPWAVRAQPAQLEFDHPASAYADNLRAIRARLAPSGAKSREKIVAVVSALPGEGKTTFASHLALDAQREGLRTLLIDGDVHAATATRAFGLQKAGLSEVLDGKVAFWNALEKDSESGLCFLGARDLTRATDQIEEIEPARLAALLQDHAKHFDLVVLDSPAILPFGGSARSIGCADRAVLLVEWNRTPRQAVAEALDLLDADARKIVGVVLSKVSVGWCRLFDYAGYGEAPSGLKRAA